MIRPSLVQMMLAVSVVLAYPAASSTQSVTENVVLVTLDGVRRQEIFGGLDLDVLRSTAGDSPVEATAAYRKYYAATPEERRRLLMPFFWGVLMTHGSVAGNQALNSRVQVTNGHWFSYPGYSEILTGQAHDAEIRSNDPIQKPFESVLEFVRRKKDWPRSKVAAFTSWGVFSAIAEHTPGSVTINAGPQRWESDDALLRQVNDLQYEVPAPWESIRHDAFTFRLAMAYLKTQKPRLFYLALDETDDWAHDGKYALALDALARTDRQLEALWTFLQSDPQYAGRTTLIITTDHGRGNTPDDWRHHGRKIDGAQHIWMAVAGPDSPRRGEWADTEPVFQNQIAATIARLLGLDFSEQNRSAGLPIEGVWQPAR